ncbi:MAG: hypothetical protein HQ596_04810 [Candidatus Saganbacteria bacterium]|nr:hypothetical protein [Candidatus Saganbacteria bacterium]
MHKLKLIAFNINTAVELPSLEDALASISAFSDGQEEAVAGILRQAGIAMAKTVLLTQLSSPETRQQLAKSLATEILLDRATGLLREESTGHQAGISARALGLLGKGRREAALLELAAPLQEIADTWAPIYAAIAVARLGNREGIPVLRRTIEERDHTTDSARTKLALRGLGEVGGKEEATFLMQKFFGVEGDVAKMGREAVVEIAKREEVPGLISQLGGACCLPTRREGVSGREIEKNMQALRLMARLGTRAEIPLLEALFERRADIVMVAAQIHLREGNVAEVLKLIDISSGNSRNTIILFLTDYLVAST